MHLPKLRALCVSIAVGIAALPVAADVVVSSKGTEEIELGDKLSTLLGTGAPEVRSSRASSLTLSQVKPVSAPASAIPAIDYSRAFLDAQTSASGGADWRCLSEALYFEARGESVRGLFAVAEVILNRVDSPRFPNTVCGVIRQGTGRKWQCQFTYFCDGLSDAVRDAAAWRRVGKVARLMLDGAERPLTNGAQFYHTRAVNPYWSRVFDRTTTIGAHHFYARG